MKQNDQTQRFLSIYKQVIAEHGISNDRILCDKVLKWSNTTLSQAKLKKRNIPDEVLFRFLNYFKIKKTVLFDTPPAMRIQTEMHKQKNQIIEFHDGTLKKIISRTDSEGFTFLILK